MSSTTLPIAVNPRTSPAASAIVWGGIICGILDLAAAFLTSAARGTSPLRVLHSIANAILGRAAFEGGAAAAALGLAMHFSVAIVLTAIFWTFSRKFRVLVKQAIAAGLVYGALAYVAMYWAVIPLCAVLRKLYLPNVTVRFPPFSYEALAIHLAFVGLPIALVVRHFSKPRT